MIRPTEQWSESTLRMIGFLLTGVTTIGVLANVVLSASMGDVGNSTEQVLLLVPFILVLVWLFRAVPRNTAVWALAWAAICGGLGDTAATVTLWSTGFPADDFTNGAVAGSPADLDLLSSIGLNVAGWSWLGIFLLSVHFVLLFPSGATSSRSWRYVMWGATGAFVMGVAGTALALAPWVDTPFVDLFDQGVFWAAGTASTLLMIASVAAITNLIIRFRRSTGEERLQYRWITTAFALWAVTLVGFGWFSDSAVYGFVYTVALAAIPFSVGIAITKYRLYDIDVVISKTLVYGTLAVFIGVVYVGIAVLPWVILGSEAQVNTWLGIVATIVVAVTFQPMRRRLERLAGRVVYGRRATPYEVLSSFSQGVSAVDPDVLGQVAKSLAEGTTADSASIWVGTGGSSHCIAAWPVLPEDLDPAAVAVPVEYEGAELGRVALEIPPGQPFPETDRRLLEQVAAGLGLALRNMQLTEDLRDRVDELAASRRRIVTVQDETRRKLERDLHDGAQQRLVALKIKLGIGSSMADKAGLDDVKAMIDTVREETDQTIDSVRDFARGIYPPLLEAEGLGQALNAQARKMPIPVTVQAAGLGRYPKGQEATVYFCVLEALQNAMKHSEASSVQVLLTDQDGQVSFEVRDDGIGFDKDLVDPNGLLNMKDRVEAIGGEFGVETEPGRGTIVSGSVPVAELVPA